MTSIVVHTVLPQHGMVVARGVVSKMTEYQRSTGTIVGAAYKAYHNITWAAGVVVVRLVADCTGS